MTIRTVRGSKRGARRRVHWVVSSLPTTAIVRIQVALRVFAIGRDSCQRVIVVDVAVRASIHLAGGRQLVRVG